MSWLRDEARCSTATCDLDPVWLSPAGDPVCPHLECGAVLVRHYYPSSGSLDCPMCGHVNYSY